MIALLQRVMRADVRVADRLVAEIGPGLLALVCAERDDSDAELRGFLDVTGFLHVARVFSRDEMAALDAEVDRLAAEARPRDDRS